MVIEKHDWLKPPQALHLSLSFLVFVNILPFIGVAFFEWDLFYVMLSYWAETLVLGFWTIARIFVYNTMIFREKGNIFAKTIFYTIMSVFQSGFFMAHFGGFMFGHLIFLTAIFGNGLQDTILSLLDGDFGFVAIFENFFALLPAIFLGTMLGMFLSHGFSFFYNYISRGEYKQERAAYGDTHPMMSIYGRVIIMHLSLLAASFLLAPFTNMGQGSVWALVGAVPLIMIKVVLDIRAHIKEHTKQQKNSR